MKVKKVRKESVQELFLEQSHDKVVAMWLLFYFNAGVPIVLKNRQTNKHCLIEIHIIPGDWEAK